ncbi:unnamed protein product [Ectocarpus sp. CCAP 1310/34]|nr:unnamed protein product [Ectocarpus sp. CCAP 1310/34]
MSPYRAMLCVVAALVLSCTSTSAFVAPTSARAATAVNQRSSAVSRSAVNSRQTQRRTSALCMEGQATYLDDPMLVPLEDDDYVAFGLACCFVMNDNLKLDEYYVYEPLTAATLETIASSQSLETSYKRVTAFRAKDIFEGPPSRPTGIQVDKLKILDGDVTAHICENPVERTLAAARTYKRRVEAQMCGYGDLLEGFNFSTERKRILNHKFEPSFDDNVKQDKSIDVYGREEEEAKQIADLENI